MNVYINNIASFLPGLPVDNETIEARLGLVGALPSRTKKRILENNGIKTRYYALDEDGLPTHTNAQLAAEAVRKLEVEKIDCLCCGSSSPDLLMPGHALMVAGELGLPPCEVVTTAGICLSGITALNYACMSVAGGSANCAVATGSELASSFMKAGFFTSEADVQADLKSRPVLGFDADFLRWMLSDGAGAVAVSREKSSGINLKVEWIENRSYAGELNTCMYAGGKKEADGSITPWRQSCDTAEAAKANLFAVRQDVKLLDREIVSTAMERALPEIAAKRGIRPEDIDWYLPHYSSHYFRQRFYDGMVRGGFEIPYEKWYTNLYDVGNVGSASIYLIMEGLIKSGRLEKGQKVLGFIPESGRFSHSFMLLTAC